MSFRASYLLSVKKSVFENQVQFFKELIQNHASPNTYEVERAENPVGDLKTIFIQEASDSDIDHILRRLFIEKIEFDCVAEQTEETDGIIVRYRATMEKPLLSLIDRKSKEPYIKISELESIIALGNPIGDPMMITEALKELIAKHDIPLLR